MSRYVVERTFPEGLEIPVSDRGTEVCRAVVDCNSDHGVSWVHSYVSADKRKTYCLYEAANAEAIREAARRANIPADVIVEVTELRPETFV